MLMSRRQDFRKGYARALNGGAIEVPESELGETSAFNIQKIDVNF